MGFDGTNLWVSYTGDLLNHAFDPATCTATGATCNPAACSAGASWYADMAYNSQSGEMCQLAVSGNNNIFCWNPTTCACGTTYANLATSERGLAYRAGTNSFFYGGWNTYTLTEMNADGGAIHNTLYIGLRSPACLRSGNRPAVRGDERYRRRSVVYDVSATRGSRWDSFSTRLRRAITNWPAPITSPSGKRTTGPFWRNTDTVSTALGWPRPATMTTTMTTTTMTTTTMTTRHHSRRMTT
jgi:hypothetical protein